MTREDRRNDAECGDDSTAAKRDGDGRPAAPDRGGDEESGGVGFTLPPLRLPPLWLPRLRVPEDLRLSIPPPGLDREVVVTPRDVLVLAAALDLLDAALALWVGSPVVAWVRVLGGMGVAALSSGVYGALYAWEAVAVAAGFEWLTVAPSLSALLLLRARR